MVVNTAIPRLFLKAIVVRSGQTFKTSASVSLLLSTSSHANICANFAKHTSKLFGLKADDPLRPAKREGGGGSCITQYASTLPRDWSRGQSMGKGWGGGEWPLLLCTLDFLVKTSALKLLERQGGFFLSLGQTAISGV